jgi:transposase
MAVDFSVQELPKGHDVNDDRLGDVLWYLSEDASWRAMERELGARPIRVYRLPQECVRLDSTKVSVNHNPEGTELVRDGHSKDQHPDLAQLKVRLGRLDPLGAPLATEVVFGDRADDELYIPSID